MTADQFEIWIERIYSGRALAGILASGNIELTDEQQKRFDEAQRFGVTPVKKKGQDMKPTAQEIFSQLASGVQDELINDLFSKVGATVVGELQSEPLFGEWLARVYFGDSFGHCDVDLRFCTPGQGIDCPNCGTDGTYEECGACGGRSYFVGPNISECRSCKARQTMHNESSPIPTTIDGSDDLTF